MSEHYRGSGGAESGCGMMILLGLAVLFVVAVVVLILVAM